MKAEILPILAILLVIAMTSYSIYVIRRLKASNQEWKDKYNKELSTRKSSEVRTGAIVEHCTPFILPEEYIRGNLRYLGGSVDFVYFGESFISFIEVKSGGARLSAGQKNIRRLVKEGKVHFEVFRVNDSGTHLERETNEEVSDGQASTSQP